jgi:hypothetical protein
VIEKIEGKKFLRPKLGKNRAMERLTENRSIKSSQSKETYKE